VTGQARRRQTRVMVYIRPPQEPARSSTVGRGDALRWLLAAVLAWVGGQSLAHLSVMQSSLRDSGVPPTTADWLAVIWSVSALLAAVALVTPAYARAGAVAAVLLASALLVFGIVAWARGAPVPCSCATPSLQHGRRHHAEAVVGDALLVVLAVITSVTARARRARAKQPGS
jgi:hypothetical protein